MTPSSPNGAPGDDGRGWDVAMFMLAALAVVGLGTGQHACWPG